MRKYFAEFFWTFWLVFGGCGAAVFAAGVPEIGIGLAGVSLAFGLTVLTMAYAVGHISGGHFNPAVSFGLWMGGRFSSKELIPYIVSQVVGATAAAACLYTILNGAGAFSAEGARSEERRVGKECRSRVAGYGRTRRWERDGGAVKGEVV